MGTLIYHLSGNLGQEGEDGMIDKIKDNKNIEILIDIDDENRCYQESEKAIDYIKENMKNKGTIENFEIYGY